MFYSSLILTVMSDLLSSSLALPANKIPLLLLLFPSDEHHAWSANPTLFL